MDRGQPARLLPGDLPARQRGPAAGPQRPRRPGGDRRRDRSLRADHPRPPARRRHERIPNPSPQRAGRLHQRHGLPDADGHLAARRPRRARPSAGARRPGRRPGQRRGKPARPHPGPGGDPGHARLGDPHALPGARPGRPVLDARRGGRRCRRRAAVDARRLLPPRRRPSRRAVVDARRPRRHRRAGRRPGRRPRLGADPRPRRATALRRRAPRAPRRGDLPASGHPGRPPRRLSPPAAERRQRVARVHRPARRRLDDRGPVHRRRWVPLRPLARGGQGVPAEAGARRRAGSYGVRYFQLRENPESVRQPHSIELQMLAELGLPGLLALLAFLGGAAGRSCAPAAARSR